MSQTLQYFKEITLYPRPSKKEEKIREYLVKFFSEKGMTHKIDNAGNLIVYVPAKNSSSSETVILQAHMDMVCVKLGESQHNFLTDAIQFYEKGGFLYAKETTLGADNGIGIALCMAAIGFDSHPNLELVFTVDEEDGMSGVAGLDYSLLKGTKIINLDSEDEDEICIGSAGGIGIIGKKQLSYKAGIFPQYKIKLTGMKGGHSGVEIDKNRGNAIISMLDFLSKYDKNIEIANISAGVASNVIPSVTETILGIENVEKFKDTFELYINEMKQTYDAPETHFLIEEQSEKKVVTENGVDILQDLLQIKNGIYAMSQKIPDFVETSINLGILKTENRILQVVYLLRSSDNASIDHVFNDTKSYLEGKGFEVHFDRGYPGWQDDPNSDLLQIAKSEFEKNIGFVPKITVVHAGLECGAMVVGLGREVNAISIGPNIDFVHSTDERVEIDSVAKMEEILKGILARL